MKNLFSLFFLSFICCLSQGISQTSSPMASPESVGISTDRLERLDAVMGDLVDKGMVAGIETAIMRRGQLVHHAAYGKRDIESNKSLKTNDLWRIYSMSKPIVSVGLMMLYESGKFQLNDPLHKYIPAFKDVQVYLGGGKTAPVKNHMKVVDILRHTSGLGYGWSGGYVDTMYYMANARGVKNNEEFASVVAKLPLYQEPGTGWQYSVSTDICGRLIEVLSGMPLDKYLKQNVFDKIGMPDTFFEVPDDKDNRFVTNYTHNKDGELTAIDHPSSSKYTKKVTLFSGGGGLVSSTSDYLKFCQMLLNGGQFNGTRFLSPKTIELMTTDHTVGIPYARGPVVLPAKGNGFGLGFSMVNDLAASGIVGSKGIYGWGGAAGTVFRIDPEEELIYIMMIQVMPYNHLQAREKFQTMVYQAIIE